MEKRLKSCLWAVAEANQKRSLITFEPDLRNSVEFGNAIMGVRLKWQQFSKAPLLDKDN
jgi:hypothetical protein